jgi:hypothetical protein
MRALNTIIGTCLIIAITSAARADEVIEIHDYVPPKPAASWDARKLPAYSAEAIVHDAWVRSWLLLDIDTHGKVTRFKFLKHPGYNLESIAANEVWKLSFDPAHTKGNTPIETKAVWRIEWPSHGWLMDRFGTAASWPRVEFLSRISPAMRVPCAGSGPLQLESVHPVYRDCSMPDVTRADSERWIVRPSRDI